MISFPFDFIPLLKQKPNCFMKIIKFECFGLQLQEPMAFITNLLITGFCFWIYKLLQDKKKYQVHQSKNWSYFFLLLGVSTFFGAFGHLFFQYTGKGLKMFAWVFSILAIYFIEKASLENIQDGGKRVLWRQIIDFKLICLVICLFLVQHFAIVLIQTVSGFLLVLGILHGIFYFKYKNKASLFVLIGILILLGSGMVYGFKISLHKWFNQEDFSHIIMLFSLVFLYQGAKRYKLSI